MIGPAQSDPTVRARRVGRLVEGKMVGEPMVLEAVGEPNVVEEVTKLATVAVRGEKEAVAKVEGAVRGG